MKVCLSCGQQVPVQYNVCPYCQKPTSGKPAGEELGAIKYLFYILAIFIPILGIIIGIVLMISDDPEKKKVGKTCLLIGILMIIIVCVLYFLLFAALFAMSI